MAGSLVRAATVGLVMTTSAWATYASSAPADVRAVIDLSGAIWRQGQADQRQTLTLRAQRSGGAWRPLVTGHARRFNQADHYGRLAAAAEKDGRLEFDVRMRIMPDEWTGGDALAAYEVVLTRVGEAWSGSWRGTFDGQAADGPARARFLPNPVMDGYVAPKTGEHPQLLIRRGRIAALRAQAKTPWGAAMLPRLAGEDRSAMNRAVGRGLLYVLTGDQARAAEARKFIEADLDAGQFFWVDCMHESAHRTMEAAIAYDLIHDTCDAAFRRRMTEALRRQPALCYRGADNPLFNPNDGSNWSAMFRSGMGMAALSLLAEGEPPIPPPPPPAIRRLDPPKAPAVGAGVPVVRMTPGEVWSDWLVAGPFDHLGDADALTALGGEPAARPEAGTKVTWRATPDANPAVRTFARIDPKFIAAGRRPAGGPAWKALLPGSVEMIAMSGRQRWTGWYLYAAMDVTAGGYYRVEVSDRRLIDPCVYVAGQRLANGDVVRLAEGRYPVLARVRPAPVDRWMWAQFYLRFHAIEAPEAQSWLARQTRYHQFERELSEVASAHDLALAVARQRIENWAASALSPGGWNTEGEAYTQHSYRTVLPLAHCYRNAKGRDLVAIHNLRAIFPLYVSRTIFGEAGAGMGAFGPGGGPLGVDGYARGFALVPPDLGPTVLWAWNRTQALADAGKLKDPHKPVDRLDPVSAAFRFVNYPLDLAERNPASVLSKVTFDAQRGGYVFRNGWRDGNDCVATVWLDANFVGGGWSSSEAGDFRLSGLGADWVVRGHGWGHGGSGRRDENPRLLMSTVAVPGPTGGGKEAVCTHFAPEPDGSGVVSMDLGDLYTAPKPPREGAAGAKPARPGARTGYDIGIRAIRSIAVDYTGASGAPCLVAIADKLTGAEGDNSWQLVTEAAHTVTTDERGFTIVADNGATLRGTVVLPAGAKVETIERQLRHEINYHGGHQGAGFRRKIIRVHGCGEFLVVLTVQRGAAPEVKATEDGPGATAGGRTVRFDGKRIVFRRR